AITLLSSVEKPAKIPTTNSKEIPNAFLRELKKIFPDNDILFGKEALPYGRDRWFASAQPAAVVFPRSTEQVSSLLKLAANYRVPVTPRGGGVGYVGGCVPVHGGIVLSTERMDKILEISKTDFIAVVQPGIKTAEVQRRAIRRGLFYPPDPASLNESTIGGNIATNAGGPRCLKYGVTRHYLLGLEVVLMGGKILRVGGRTHKNKTGLDLVGLFTGSEGLLGVITEATLRLLPLPPFRGAICAGFPNIRSAALAIQKVFYNGLLPAAAEIADKFTLQSARNFLKLKKPNLLPSGDACVIFEVDGQKETVPLELKKIGQIIQGLGAIETRFALSQAACNEIWEIRRTFSDSLKATGLRKLNEDVTVPRGKIVDLVLFAQKIQKKYDFPVACFGHAGDGNIHVNIMVGDWTDEKIRSKAEAALDELFNQVLAWQGVITGEHGIGLAKLPWWPKALSKETRATQIAIKKTLDPLGLLNPGKFL
ncbi:MAG: FAD-binding protein, partial [Chthoniobacterales bacterium]|nr:FAD-binding protein [Chthoniobacterales bacterium]